MSKLETIAAAVLVCLGLVFMVSALMACAEPYPTSEDSPLIGTWSGYFPTDPPLLINLEIEAAGNRYTAIVSGDSGILKRERGTWKHENGDFIMSPVTCESEIPLRLVACTSPDTMSVDLDKVGNWYSTFLDATGIVRGLVLRRVD